MDNDIYKKIRDADMAYERVFHRDKYNGRSTEARRRIERQQRIRQLKEAGEEIYWDRLH